MNNPIRNGSLQITVFHTSWIEPDIYIFYSFQIFDEFCPSRNYSINQNHIALGGLESNQSKVFWERPGTFDNHLGINLMKKCHESKLQSKLKTPTMKWHQSCQKITYKNEFYLFLYETEFKRAVRWNSDVLFWNNWIWKCPISLVKIAIFWTSSRKCGVCRYVVESLRLFLFIPKIAWSESWNLSDIS